MVAICAQPTVGEYIALVLQTKGYIFLQQKWPSYRANPTTHTTNMVMPVLERDRKLAVQGLFLTRICSSHVNREAASW